MPDKQNRQWPLSSTRCTWVRTQITLLMYIHGCMVIGILQSINDVWSNPLCSILLTYKAAYLSSWLHMYKRQCAHLIEVLQSQHKDYSWKHTMQLDAATSSSCPVVLSHRLIGFVWRLLLQSPSCYGSSWGDCKAAHNADPMGRCNSTTWQPIARLTSHSSLLMWSAIHPDQLTGSGHWPGDSNITLVKNQYRYYVSFFWNHGFWPLQFCTPPPKAGHHRSPFFYLSWGGLHDLGAFGNSEPNWCEPNQITYRQGLPKVVSRSRWGSIWGLLGSIFSSKKIRPFDINLVWQLLFCIYHLTLSWKSQLLKFTL